MKLKTLACLFLITITGSLASAAHGQTFTIIHDFSNGLDGGGPRGDLVLDRTGNIYGTTEGGSDLGNNGTVFRLFHQSSGWVLGTLYLFAGGSDGAAPVSGVTIGPNGNLFGTTFEGGVEQCNPPYGCGTVFSLQVPAAASKAAFGPWAETVLYRFTNEGGDGVKPYGGVIFDADGNLYGSTGFGGTYGWGTIYELTPYDGGWKETLLYSFTGGVDAGAPTDLTFDSAGNIDGTTIEGAGGPGMFGSIFQLTPSGSAWRENTLYTFKGGRDGGNPYAGLIPDARGNLYGATPFFGSGGGGTVYEMTKLPNGNWTFSVLYSFTGNGGPLGRLAMDAAGNLYGTTYIDGLYGLGSVFKLTPSDNGWTYTSLHDFTGGSDGENPWSSVVVDANGNIYGTACCGGAKGYGVAFEITP